MFLIHQYSRIGNNTYWVFPKGHPEAGETPEETARRELKEETDMLADKLIRDPVFKLQYSFHYDGNLIDKTVVFFLGLVSQIEYQLDPEEVKEAGWYSLADAKKRLDYSDTKQMFSEVTNFLASQSALEI